MSIPQFHFRTPLIGLFLSLCLTTSAAAQTGPYVQAWVDPIQGAAAGGTLLPTATGTAAPFRRLGDAIAAVNAQLSGLPPGAEGIVWAAPGIYSPLTNSENLPVFMQNGVHVIATGDAKETVIRDSGDGSNTLPLFVPDSPNSGRRQAGLPLVDFTVSGTQNQLDSMPSVINGFTFQGGDVQVYVETELDFYDLRVSNCIFDLRDFGAMPGQPSLSPRFGFQSTSTWDYIDEEHGGLYPDVPSKLFNNTFIFNTANEGDMDALIDTVGIIDVVDPCPVSDPAANDPVTTLRGESNLSVQNNLFRITRGNIPMLGIDLADAQIASGVPTGPTNAFPSPNVAHRSPSARWFSQTINGFPVPAVDLTATPPAGGVRLDPAFAGEYFETEFLADVFDWRLLPTAQNAVIDAGSAPTNQGRFDSLSGVRHVDRGQIISDPTRRVHHFSWDGEGWGNDRIVGDGVDIGYDETDTYLQGGSYGADSRSHNLSYAPGVIANGGPLRVAVFPAEAALTTVQFYTTSELYPLAPSVGWTLPPGIAASPMSYPNVPGFDWLTGGTSPSPWGAARLLVPTTHIHRITGVAHLFQINDEFQTLDQLLPTPLFLNLQAVYSPLGSPTRITNLQREHF